MVYIKSLHEQANISELEFPAFVTAQHDFSSPGTLVSDEARNYMWKIVDLWLSLTVCIFGTFTNALVIATFIYQGLKDSVVISLFAIALMDLLACLTGGVTRLSGVIDIFNPRLAYSWYSVSYVSLNLTNVGAVMSSGVLAAYVAVERCVCVNFPFHVKQIFTPPRTAVTVILSSSVVFGSFSILYCSTKLVDEFLPIFNTILKVNKPSDLFLKNSRIIMNYYNTVAIFWPTASFFIMLMSTLKIQHGLKQSSKFKTRNASFEFVVNEKEMKTMKMLLVVILIYLFTISLRLMVYIGRFVNSDFIEQGFYNNIYLVVSYVIYFVNFINASVNFFIYLNMSSNFRSDFFRMIEKIICRWKVW